MGGNWVCAPTSVSLEVTKGQALQSICGKKKETIAFTLTCQALEKCVRSRTSEMPQDTQSSLSPREKETGTWRGPSGCQDLNPEHLKTDTDVSLLSVPQVLLHSPAWSHAQAAPSAWTSVLPAL